MKYPKTITLLFFTIFLPSLILGIYLNYQYNLPPRVSFTIPIERQYNATEFSYYTRTTDTFAEIDETYLNNKGSLLEEHYHPFYDDPLSIDRYNTIHGVARVDSEVTLSVKYYCRNDTVSQIGLNTQTKPEIIQVGNEYLTVTVKELADNRVSQIDSSSNLLWFASGFIVFIFLCATIATMYEEKALYEKKAGE